MLKNIAVFCGALALLSAWPVIAAETPIIQKLLTSDIEVRPDGLLTQVLHSEIQATNEAAAQNIGQQAIPYSESMYDLDIIDAYTLKPDGKKLSVNAKAIYPQLVPGVTTFPMFDDQKQKTIVFPDVAAGDSVVYTIKIRQKRPNFPGQFTVQSVFPRTNAVSEFRETVTAPKSLPLSEEVHDIAFTKETKGDKIIYHFHYSAPEPLVEDIAAVSPLDRSPRLFLTSFKDYDALGRAYAAIANPKIKVTPKIQAQADEITAGITDRRQQAQKIYEWVSKHIRYVLVIFGASGFEPHEAESVLSNGYGDCKDHTVLFAALLKAKGIESQAVLINYGNGYHAPDVPITSEFNHLIDYLPEFGLYADTTAGVAPFGTLPFEEYGKPVVHAVTTGAALRQTPVLPGDLATSTMIIKKHLDAEGVMTEDSATEAAGPISIALRLQAKNIQAQGSERVAQAMLKRAGNGGTGRFEFAPPDDMAPAYSVSSHYQAEPRPRILAGDGFSLGSALALLSNPGDYIMGPLWQEKLKDTEPTPCYSGHMVQEIALEIPDGKHVAKLPDGAEVQSQHLHYSAHWSVAGQTVTLRREFTTNIDQPLCTGETRKEAAQALAKIRDDYRTQISLAAD